MEASSSIPFPQEQSMTGCDGQKAAPALSGHRLVDLAEWQCLIRCQALQSVCSLESSHKPVWNFTSALLLSVSGLSLSTSGVFRVPLCSLASLHLARCKDGASLLCNKIVLPSGLHLAKWALQASEEKQLPVFLAHYLSVCVCSPLSIKWLCL